MELDTLGRRKRGTVTSTGVSLRVTEDDLEMLLALQDHGVLPTNYLAKFRRTSLDYTRDRIGDFVHEEVPGYGRLLKLPFGWDRTKYALSNFYQVQLTEAGHQWLKDNGYAQDTIKPSGEYVHQLMISTITASIELTARKCGITYIPGHVILEKADTPRQETYRVPIWGFGKGRLICDQFFALRYPDQTYEAFCVEADRGGEQNAATKKSKGRKTFEDTFDRYKKYIGGKEYKDHLGLNCDLKVLNVEAQLGTMRNHINIAGSSDFMLFQHVEGFGPSFRTPPIMSQLVAGDWFRPGRSTCNLSE